MDLNLASIVLALVELTFYLANRPLAPQYTVARTFPDPKATLSPNRCSPCPGTWFLSAARAGHQPLFVLWVKGLCRSQPTKLHVPDHSVAIKSSEESDRECKARELVGNPVSRCCRPPSPLP